MSKSKHRTAVTLCEVPARSAGTLCGKPTRDEARVCDRDAVALGKALRDVDGLLGDLEVARTGQARIGAGGRVSAHGEVGLTVNTGAVAAETELRDMVAAWHWHLVQPPETTAQRHAPARTTPSGYSGNPETAQTVSGPRTTGPVCVACRHDSCARIDAGGRRAPLPVPHLNGPTCSAGYGCTHRSCTAIWERALEDPTARQARELARIAATTIRLHPNGPAIIHDLAGVIRRARRVVDRRPELVFLGPCGIVTDPGTGTRCPGGLNARPGQTWVRCDVCNTTHDVNAVRGRILTEARDHLWSANDIAGTVGEWLGIAVSAATIRQWRHRGRLEPAHSELVTDDTGALIPDRTRPYLDEHGKHTHDAAGRPQYHPKQDHLYRVGDVVDLLVASAQHSNRRRAGADT